MGKTFGDGADGSDDTDGGDGGDSWLVPPLGTSGIGGGRSLVGEGKTLSEDEEPGLLLAEAFPADPLVDLRDW